MQSSGSVGVGRGGRLAGVRGADPPGPLGHRGVLERLLRLRLPLGVAFHEVHVLLVLPGLGALSRPPLLGEAHVPAGVLGGHQSRVVVLQDLLNEHTLLTGAIRLQEERGEGGEKGQGGCRVHSCVQRAGAGGHGLGAAQERSWSPSSGLSNFTSRICEVRFLHWGCVPFKNPTLPHFPPCSQELPPQLYENKKPRGSRSKHDFL